MTIDLDFIDLLGEIKEIKVYKYNLYIKCIFKHKNSNKKNVW